MSLLKVKNKLRQEILRSSRLGSFAEIMNTGCWLYLNVSLISLFFWDNFIAGLTQLFFYLTIFFVARLIYFFILTRYDLLGINTSSCYEKYTFYVSSIMACVFGNPLMYNPQPQYNIGDDFFALIFMVSLMVSLATLSFSFIEKLFD